ncbi:MAG TPA: hypothetical protein VFO77_02765 [Actinoplanes sp.]|nr:hypothetical protein [Actinoplanes sp.]
MMRRKSRGQLVRQELRQSAEHFKQAATHAARGTGATVGPKLDAARERIRPATGRVADAASSSWGSTIAVLTPLTTAATDSARQAGKKGRKARDKNMKKMQKQSAKLQRRSDKAIRRSGKSGRGRMAKLLIAGTAIGAGAAFVMRRRQGQQWDEYDPSRPMGATDPSRPMGATESAGATPMPTPMESMPGGPTPLSPETTAMTAGKDI